MPRPDLDYGRLVEGALRRVVRDALAMAAEYGMPGRHHFYITFRTDHPGVVIADSLRARYPSEMTIVLQYEFWELEVRDDGFGVTLSFADLPHRLEVPFDAISVFADPSVEFGLQFNVAGVPETVPATARRGATSAPLAEVPPARPEEGAQPTEGAEVVALDRFRKR
jgi:hypothetical protein